MRKLMLCLLILTVSFTIQAADREWVFMGPQDLGTGDELPPVVEAGRADGDWTLITSLQPDWIVFPEYGAVATFGGAPGGIWLFDYASSKWQRLTLLEPEDSSPGRSFDLACGTVYAVIAGQGLLLYDYDAERWRRINYQEPLSIERDQRGNSLIAEFDSGIWHYDCPGAAVVASVPKTGQTECWDVSGTPIGCSATGQDGEYQMGASVSPRFTGSGDGTVTDNLTGLIWLQTADCFGAQNWGDALTLANTLAHGSCGLTDGSLPGDWRLPNIKELQSLVDFGHADPGLPPDHPFSGVQPYNYWSSSSFAFNPNRAWDVYLYGGYVHANDKPFPRYVWPVRGDL